MSVFRRFFSFFGQHPRSVVIGGMVTLTTAGAISTQTTADIAGGTASKTGGKSGRYAVAFQRTNWKRIIAHGCTMVGPDDSAFPTTTGSAPKTRLVSTSGLSVQFIREDTQADADPASGTKFSWWAIVSTV